MNLRGNEAGYALVSVLWAVSLLSLIAAVLIHTGLAAMRGSQAARERAQSQAMFEAGLTRAVLAVIDSREGERWSADGKVHNFTFEGAELSAAISDEQGKIDLNFAPRDTLFRLFQSADLEERDAARLADEILKRRDSASEASRPADPLRARSGSHGPPFRAIDEIKVLPGVTEDAFAKLAPALTVYAHRAMVDPAFASAQVLAAAQGIDEDAAKQLIEARQRTGSGATVSGIVDPLARPYGHTLDVRLTAPTEEGTRIQSKAIVMITGDAKRPYLMLRRD